MDVSYKPTFVRQFNKLEIALQTEVLEKIELFKSSPAHSTLKVHKLTSVLQGCYSFSVNYSIRIVFQYETKQEAVLLAVGDHNVYKR
jgi:mRNA-degrading endonuclease YafQ of YafQ-DinJ toxin-antitoxin module